MDSDAGGGDVFENDTRSPESERKVELGADSGFDNSVVVTVLNNQHGVVEGALASDVSENSFKTISDVVVVFADDVDGEGVEMAGNIVEFELAFSVLAVVDSEEGVNFIIDFVAEEQVGFGNDVLADVVDDHVAE